MENQQIIALLKKYDAGRCTEEEQALVETWYIRQKPFSIQELSNTEFESDLNDIFKRLPQSEPLKRRLWFIKWTVAATLICCVAVAMYMYLAFKDTAGQPDYALEIRPGKSAATLTLSNGRKIILSDSQNGLLAEERGVSISKTTEGKLVYQILPGKNNGDPSVEYHTLSTSNGEQYQVVLPDGTKVWLNAASSLKFPAKFEGQARRKVRLVGEAYFEVFKDKAHPFLVESDRQLVTVLGTHFNINSYPDEGGIKTTLLEGSVTVEIIGAGERKRLQPNQQAIVTDRIRLVEIDSESSIDWKEGNFYFSNERIDEVMRKLARWYDIEVIYKNNIRDVVYGGEISRRRNLPDVLKLLEVTGTVHFKVEGRRVTVMQ